MSVFDDMAHDAGYRDDDAEQVARMLEEQERAEHDRYAQAEAEHYARLEDAHYEAMERERIEALDPAASPRNREKIEGEDR